MNAGLEIATQSAAGQGLDLALIGKCRVAALVDIAGRIVWWCFPRFDSNPVFSRLLAGEEEKGFCDVVMADLAHTCEAIGRRLIRNGRIMRYTGDDDFGAPETAFLACNFWFIEALASIGRRDEARAMFTDLLERRNRFGLLSEDIHPDTGALRGNFPQTYSMAGIIVSATQLSKKWEDVRCRVSS